jgi:hypothetical protein
VAENNLRSLLQGLLSAESEAKELTCLFPFWKRIQELTAAYDNIRKECSVTCELDESLKELKETEEIFWFIHKKITGVNLALGIVPQLTGVLEQAHNLKGSVAEEQVLHQFLENVKVLNKHIFTSLGVCPLCGTGQEGCNNHV